MTTIYLIRHAEAEGNLYRRAHGWYNSTITDRGYRQIAALTKRFTDTKFDAVYSSDRFRTMITALSIYKTHGLPLRTVRALREIDVGYWEDTPWAELERIDPEQLANFSNDSQNWHVPGCESFAEVRERMRKALTEIAEAHPNGTVAAFSHGMAMRIIVGTLQGMTLHEIDKTGHAENTAVAKLEYENGTFNVIFRDDASHLGDNIATVRKQPWVNDPKGFEGGIYYRASGEAGHFDVMHGGDVIGDGVPVAVLDHGEVDDHVDLVRALGDGVRSLEGLGGGGHVAVGEADDGADGHAAREVFLRARDVAGRYADGGAAVLHGLVAELADLSAARVGAQQGVVAAGKYF